MLALCNTDAHDHTRRHLVFDAAVETLGVLPNNDQVHVLVSSVNTGHAAHGPHRRIQIEGLA